MNRSPKVIIGSDLLDIVSIAMYADPLVAYRELIQNSADAIDKAARQGIMELTEGRVDFELDPVGRNVVVRDNGYGVENDNFESTMSGLGTSAKRGDSYRGFRGIGRLAGLGNCRSLSFRSRSRGDRYIFEARWDGQKVREASRSASVVPLEELAQHALSFRQAKSDGEPDHFFEVRLEGVRRLSDDRLLDAAAISKYLSQVAPVPFHPSFSFGGYITEELERRMPLLQLQLSVKGVQVFKPYRDRVEVRTDRFVDISGPPEIIELPSSRESDIAAVGWIAHTQYLGSFKPSFAGRGLRVRSGNVQIGDEHVLSGAFPEDRFNLWAIGEFHVFDPQLRPNARRDAFEPSVAVDDLFNNLRPYAANIARRCRDESRQRNALRRVDAIMNELESLKLALSRNRSPLAMALREVILEKIRSDVDELSKVSADERLLRRLREAEAQVVRALRPRPSGGKSLSSRQRGQVDVMSSLIRAGESAIVASLLRDWGRS